MGPMPIPFAVMARLQSTTVASRDHPVIKGPVAWAHFDGPQRPLYAVVVDLEWTVGASTDAPTTVGGGSPERGTVAEGLEGQALAS